MAPADSQPYARRMAADPAPGGSPDFDGLRALFINCTLKRSPEVSNTQALVDASSEIMSRHGVSTEVIRLVDHDVATGLEKDGRAYPLLLAIATR